VTKAKLWASIAAASALGVIAYAVSRRGTSAEPIQRTLAKTEARVPVTVVAPIALEDDVASVAFLVKAPPISSADDAEALDPDDLGREWLAHAAQSEPSVSAFDREIALEDLADPTAEAAILDSLEPVET
jgi:hypothetical protein